MRKTLNISIIKTKFRLFIAEIVQNNNDNNNNNL